MKTNPSLLKNSRFLQWKEWLAKTIVETGAWLLSASFLTGIFFMAKYMIQAV